MKPLSCRSDVSCLSCPNTPASCPARRVQRDPQSPTEVAHEKAMAIVRMTGDPDIYAAVKLNVLAGMLANNELLKEGV